MNKLLLGLIGAATLAMPAVAGQPAEQPIENNNLEQKVEKEKFLRQVIPERYDYDNRELIVWVHLGDNVLCKIKQEMKLDFAKEQMDGKKKCFTVDDIFVAKDALQTIKKDYALTPEMKAIEISKTVAEKKPLPKDINQPIEVEFENLFIRLVLQPYYLPDVEVKVEEFKFIKDTKMKDKDGNIHDYKQGAVVYEYIVKKGQQSIGKSQGEVLIPASFLSDRVPDFGVWNYEETEKDGKKEKKEVVALYDIKKDGSLDLRVITERIVPKSEEEDCAASMKYKTILASEAGLTQEGEKITEFSCKNGVLFFKYGDKFSKAEFEVPRHLGHGKLPDFVILDENNKKHYAKINRNRNDKDRYGKIELIIAEKGNVEFSKELDSRLKTLTLKQKEKVEDIF